MHEYLLDSALGMIKMNKEGVVQTINCYVANALKLKKINQLNGHNIIEILPEYSLEIFYTGNSDYSIQLIQSMELITCSFYVIEDKEVNVKVLLYPMKTFYRFLKKITDGTLQEEELKVLDNIMALKVERETPFKSLKKEVGVIGNSKEMQEIFQLIEKTAGSNATILLTGETGVGKSLFAKIIHDASPRKHKNFVDINCGTINSNLIESELFGYEEGAFTGAKVKGRPGRIQMAHEGTVFLDEITELPLDVQNRLLQVIQEKKISPVGSNTYTKVDFRLVVATNKNLEDLVKQGGFREDLFYRINVIPIHIPPIRKRTDDIIAMALSFVRRYNDQYGRSKSFSQDTIQLFCKYSWPGNVREMENLIERLVLTSISDVIQPHELPSIFKEVVPEPVDFQSAQLNKLLDEYEKDIILDAYKKYKTSVLVAEKLGISQATAARKIRKYTEEI